MTKFGVRSIRLERVEGRCEECVTVEVGSFEAAHDTLRQWGLTAPAPGGGYDKCDFTVNFASGDDTISYSGRFDLILGGTDDGGDDLRTHVRRFCEFASGRVRPDHIDPASYQMILKRAPDLQVFCAKLLDTCEV